MAPNAMDTMGNAEVRLELCKRTRGYCHLYVWLMQIQVSCLEQVLAIHSVPLNEHMPQCESDPSHRICCFFSQPICLQCCEHLNSQNMILGLNTLIFHIAWCQNTSQNVTWHSTEERMIELMLQEKLSDFVGYWGYSCQYIVYHEWFCGNFQGEYFTMFQFHLRRKF